MKKTVTTILLTINLIVLAQVIPSKKNLIGYWQSQDDTTNYFVFSKDQSIRMRISQEHGIVDLYFTYGFCDELKLKSINDLKDEGYYYFEVEEWNFDKENREKDGTYSGIQANVIQMEDDKNSFQIYDSARPGQRGTYKRIDQLPSKLARVLKSKNIVINTPTQSSKPKFLIKSTKSIIYKTPNIPTKMYLIRGNEVEVLEQKGNWLRIRYYGKKTIEGWVKKEDVE